MKTKEEEINPVEQRSDLLERLLRMAGSRPAVPEDIALRVKSNVHARWKQSVHSRARAKFVMTFAGAIAACLVVYFVSWHFITREPAQPTPVGIAEMINGNIVLNEEGKEHARLLDRGAILMSGSTLESDDSGRMLLRLLQGVTLRLDINSRLRVDGHSQFYLDKGAAYLDCARSSSPLAVITPLGKVVDQGTQYEVRVQNTEMSIGVREGSVLLTSDQIKRTVEAGKQLILNQEGTTHLNDLAPYGSYWSWVGQVAPVYHLEGRSLMEFLGWVTRENGWSLSFSDSRIKESAPHIILHGSLQNVAPDQMPEAVLPVCGLSFSIEKGTLIVKPGKRS